MTAPPPAALYERPVGEPVRVLDEAGRLIPGTVSPMTDDTAIEALRLMLLSRAVDRYAVALQRQGVFGTYGEARGQEATLAGAALAVDPAVDWMVPQYRELPALHRHGMPLELLFLMYTYHPAGFTVPDGVNVLCNQVSLAAQLPHAVGLAWGLKLQRKPGVVLAFVGDGGSSEGDFHEACNLAGVVGAPVVFVVQNNGWAISTPTARQTAADSIAQRAAGYGIPGVLVDGNDLFAVYAAVHEATQRARTGGGATLVECRTYRLGAHNTNDDPSRYRTEDEPADWARRDPIERVRRHLAARDLWDEERERAEDEAIRSRLDAALEWARAQPAASLANAFHHVYADAPPRLHRQQRQLAEDGAG